MGTLRARSRRRVVAGVGVGAALAAVAWMLVQGTRGAEIATVLGLLVAGLSLLLALPASADRDDRKLGAVANQLARNVHDQEARVLHRLLADSGDPAPADLSFVQPPLIYWRTDGGDRQGTLRSIDGYYRGLKRGRLVVLGDAGAGKTVLAIQLVLDLAAAVLAGADDKRPALRVPVRLSLSTFDPASGTDDLDRLAADVVSNRLDNWLIQHLATVFGLSRKIAATLVIDGRILPVLDGLDEMDVDETQPRRAAAVIRALNHSAAGGLRPIVITCRTGRYQQLVEQVAENDVEFTYNNEVVQDATVVSVEPLTVERVVQYLTYRFPDPGDADRIEPRWQPVIDRLTNGRAGDPLAASMGSPLRLFLAMIAYRHYESRPAELTQFAATEQLDEHLFSRLIPAVVQQHSPPLGRQATPPAITQWLTTLTRHLSWQAKHGGSPTDLELHRLWPAAGWRAPRYIAAALVTTVAAVPLLVVLFYAGWPSDALFIPAVSGCLVMAMVTVVAWRSSLPEVDLRRLSYSPLRTFPGRRRFRRSLAFGLGFGLLVGVGSLAELGFLIGFWVEAWPSAVKFWLLVISGLTVGFGLAVGLATKPSTIDRPARLVRQGLAHYAAVIVVGVLAYAPASVSALAPMLELESTLVTASQMHTGESTTTVDTPLGIAVFHDILSEPEPPVPPYGPVKEIIVSDTGVIIVTGPKSVVTPMGVMRFQETRITVFTLFAFIFMHGLALVLPTGFALSARSPWPRYLLATVILARRGDLPWRPAAFLDWAHTAGLVRLSGIAVQFRHREFQTWLTNRDKRTCGGATEAAASGSAGQSTGNQG